MRTRDHLLMICLAVMFGAVACEGSSTRAVGLETSPAGEFYRKPAVVGKFRTPRINECSGIGASRRQKDVLWVHNDSGGAARIYAVKKDGALVALVDVPGAKASDWEDISAGPGPKKSEPYLYIADVGNNGFRRTVLTLYRIAEPDLSRVRRGTRVKSEAAVEIPFRYDGGNYDCEAFAVHPVSGDGYLVSKTGLRAIVFRIADLKGLDASGATAVQVAKKVGTLAVEDVVTAVDLSRDGKRFIVRTYFTLSEYALAKKTPFSGADKPRQLWRLTHREHQGESVCYSSNGSILTASEGVGAAIIELEKRPSKAESRSDPTAESDGAR